MKFHLAINFERLTPDIDMRAVRDHTLDMVKMADAAGFEIAWAAEHHTLEMTIAPNPFQMLAWWGDHAPNIRLGVGVVNASYWHPIKLAGEAAMLDLLSEGRLEFGIGSGAYQREFDRMFPGLDQRDAWKYMQEMLPVVRKLWEGDYEHKGEFWSFPRSTACPKPLQSNVPVWVAARAPITFDYGVAQGCNLMSWPLTMPFAEAESYRERLDAAIEKNGGVFNGEWAIMRHTAVYENEEDRQATMDSLRGVLGQFGNLMTQKGDVVNGFPDPVPLGQLTGNMRYDPDALEENLVFGSPEVVTEKLKLYENVGADSFIYYASMGLDHARQKRSLELFIEKVLPNFQNGGASNVA